MSEPFGEMYRLAVVNAYQVHRGCCIGDPPPYIVALRDSLRNPSAGDWVLEWTRLRKGGMGPEGVALGRLIAHGWESVTATDTGNLLWDEYWYTETPSGACVRWNNAAFIRVLDEPFRMGADGDAACMAALAEKRQWAEDAAKRHSIDLAAIKEAPCVGAEQREVT